MRVLFLASRHRSRIRQPVGRAATARTLPAARNVHVVAHLPLGGSYTTADIEIEQELSRPYVYVSATSAAPGSTSSVSRTRRGRRSSTPGTSRTPSCTPGRGGTGRPLLQDQGPLLLRPVVPVCGRRARRRPGRRSFRRHRSAGHHEDQGSRAGFASRKRPADSTTLFPYKHSDGRVTAVHHARGHRTPTIYDIGQVRRQATPQQGWIGQVPGSTHRGERPDGLSRFLRGVRSGHPAGQVLRRRRASRLLRLSTSPGRKNPS